MVRWSLEDVWPLFKCKQSDSLDASTRFRKSHRNAYQFYLCIVILDRHTSTEGKKTSASPRGRRVFVQPSNLDEQMPRCGQGPIDCRAKLLSPAEPIPPVLCFCWLKTRATVALVAVVAPHREAGRGRRRVSARGCGGAPPQHFP